jgi:hypothetical protein
MDDVTRRRLVVSGERGRQFDLRTFVPSAFSLRRAERARDPEWTPKRDWSERREDVQVEGSFRWRRERTREGAAIGYATERPAIARERSGQVQVALPLLVCAIAGRSNPPPACCEPWFVEGGLQR